MMNRLSHFRNMAVVLICALLAFSCSNEDDSGMLPAGEYPMTFSTSVQQELTRSTVYNAWDGGEEIAIQIGGTVKRYVAEPDHKLYAVRGVDPFYWQFQAEAKTVTGWFPYNATAPANWSVQSDQSDGYQQSDFLYAPATAISFANRETSVLAFYHQTAKVVVNILNAEAATNASNISSVMIGYANNLALSGNYAAPTGNATQGTWSNLTSSGSIIPQEFWGTGNFLRSYSALVIPQDMTGKKLIAVTLTNGNTYYYTPTGTDGILQGGKEYTYSVTITRTGITVSVGDIIGWIGIGDPTTEGEAGV